MKQIDVVMLDGVKPMAGRILSLEGKKVVVTAVRYKKMVLGRDGEAEKFRQIPLFEVEVRRANVVDLLVAILRAKGR